jgi:DnaJ-class molecular chaperone
MIQPFRLHDAFESYQPGRDEIWDWWRRNFDTRHESKSRRVKDLNVEVVISADQARRGGAIAIEVPIGWLCDQCEGSGSTGYFSCDACEGHGMLWDNRQIDVVLSAPVRDGTVMPVSLAHLGVGNVNLRIHVRVAQ